MAEKKGRAKKAIRHDVSLLTDQDIYLFKEGNHFNLYDKLGAHPFEADGERGTVFAVWAPNAKRVSVIGDFNAWNNKSHPLAVRWDGSGIWEGFVPDIGEGTVYKYYVASHYHDHAVEKSDPLAFYCETPSRTASIVHVLDFQWTDAEWMAGRQTQNALDAPLSIYELHLGSWRRVPEEDNRPLTYREMAHYLPEYIKDMGFTHVQFLPIMEHPFYGSWGYQITGFFAPTSRYGTPQDFMYLINRLHENGIGVILDWVPSHFPDDEHGLIYFDGTHLYEHSEPKKGFHPDWKSYIFNYGRHEVKNFLISSAIFWLDRYHIDGLRVDAVASMLYLDYGRKDGEWIPNEYGGNENLEAVGFLRRFNEMVYSAFPDVQTTAEESTAWPMVSRPSYIGGLGFGMKWNMGWMHDTLKYFSQDPVFRKYHHNQLTFSILYAFSENFVLPLSHDEVVHGKGSLLGKMSGDEWQRYANLRLLLGYMFGHPGKKLLFMGSEIAQWKEWNHDESVEWHALEYPSHRGVHQWVKDLNRFYRETPALYEVDFAPAGFEWVDCQDSDKSIVSFLRKSAQSDETVLIVCNFTPVPRYNYRIGVPRPGFWREMLNSDATIYGGSGHGNTGGTEASPVPSHGTYYSLSLVLPPLGILFFRHGGAA